MSTIIDGKLLSEKIKKNIYEEVQYIKKKKGKCPKLTIIIIGNNKSSHFYVKNKIKACEDVGFEYKIIKHEKIKKNELLKIIENENKKNDGLIIQLPLPHEINAKEIINNINPEKDVDGLHFFNYGKILNEYPAHIPATPLGIMELIKEYKIKTKGKNCVIIGKSKIVGLPLSILMSRNDYPGNSTVTLCDKLTKNISYFTKKADILISATGIPGLITEKMIKNESTIIDVGIKLIEDKKKKLQ